jgi:hypothetical protein
MTTERVVGLATITGGILALAAGALFLAAVDFDLRSAVDIREALATSAADPDLVRWGAVTDMAGYYLLLAPLVLYLRRTQPWRSPVIGDVAAFAGLAYVVIGAAGAAVLASAAPRLMEAGQETEVLRALIDAVVGGLWQTLEPLPFACWAIGVGVLLRRTRPHLGTSAIVMGVAALAVSGATITGLDALFVAGLVVWLGVLPLWMLWFGAVLIRAGPTAGHEKSKIPPSRNDFQTVGR